MPPAILVKVRNYLKPDGDRNALRIRRRRKLVGAFWAGLSSLIVALLVAGYLWMVAIPLPTLGQRAYIDENALQPGQVNTYWSWEDVHRADRFLEALEQLRDRNASRAEIADYLVTEFRKAGLAADTQEYAFTTTSESKTGVNTYAIFSSPRASRTEAMIISASWLSRTGEGDGTLNLRGVSTVLSLAWFLRGYSLWAKDLIFVVSDGYLDGMQAWVTTYHGVLQPNIQAEPLRLSSGVIWTALNIDYPGHSFSHLGVFFEGLNGRLPNQDLINSFQRISQYTGGVPMIVYDHQDSEDGLGLPPWTPGSIKDNDQLKEYARRAKNIVRHVGYQARGQASGVHGLLHQFRIDAITLFAVPAAGPHGFHAIGRIVESTLRTMNNLLERLHASFFFFLLVGPTTFLKIGSFLPSAVLISVAMMFCGLQGWVKAGWAWVIGEAPDNTPGEKIVRDGRWSRRRRPVLKAIVVMAATHALGAVVFYLSTREWYHSSVAPLAVFSLPVLLPLPSLLLPSKEPTQEAPLSVMLKSLNLCLTSTVISILSVLNFSLAAVMAFLTGVPLCYASSSPRAGLRILKYAAYTALAFGWIVLQREEVLKAVANWELLGVWFAPFVCIVYAPLVLQSALVCLLPSESQ
ncbi:Gaa1-domain-containing protein [Fomitopsis serialis]|uniref:Gaa1-domain-containing protein n=1 Tax=Fomitopsis serialis TaxID=139415 RepID=UPI002007CF69|nr:Gaa1-domain-containing protein [Neoantrodia serialis]KAH9934715.1 Gaa1-domain-containing protein [Neoantrodia serialis]